MARLSFRCSDELVARVDAARGDVARERWLRRTVEQALGPTGGDLPALSTPPRGDDPAPAEQPVGPEVLDRLDHSPFAREFRPYPKGGKR